jgi:DNA primase
MTNDATHRPCPICAGVDRFYLIIQPTDGGGPYWRCRQCDYTEPHENDNEDVSERAGQTHARTTLTDAQREIVYAAYTWVAERCAQNLWTIAGRAALDYLHQRGFHDATIREAGLGWCGDGATLMTRLFYQQASVFDTDSLYEGARIGGLRKRQGVPRLVLQKTITIPYYDSEQRCVLLRGRALATTQGSPKYRSPAGPLYAGGPPRFYLHAVIRDAPRVILTEGELKALAAHQAWRAGTVDLPCVATCGVDYLPDLLIDALHGRTVYLCYDNEVARPGERMSAADRALKKHGSRLQARGLSVKVITLPRPDGIRKMDIDSYLHGTA